ncbi:MAG: ATP-binding protein [Euryarchaeota archaeon]|nr:ATP-binding protein [Euryarchaeota archaeon]MDE1836662.1 ATP-binding protein [Euryarchaeota archaeon]MDE1880309.1 ATP-binding protein [Euryarchaeota archaeon]MDE2044632.1 ATP-binding protein [Thermoplasmata archaeon]
MPKKVLHIGARFSVPAEEYIEARTAIIGQSGLGKSGLLKVVEEELVRVGLPFVVFDPAGVGWGIKSSRDGKSPGLPVLVIGGAHQDLPLNANTGAEVARAIVEANVSCVIDFSEEPKAAYRRFLKDFCDTIYGINDTSRLLVIDEAKEVLPQTVRPDNATTYDAVERIVRMGRNKGLGVTLISQRAATVNKDALCQCGTMVIFGLTGTPDRKALREWVEAWGTEKQLEQFDRELAALKVRECFFWSPREFQRFEKVFVREFETFHPDRTHLRKTGMLKVRVTTTDVAPLVTKLGETFKVLAEKKAEAANVPKLRAELATLKKQLEAAKARPDPGPTVDPVLVSRLRMESSHYQQEAHRLAGIVSAMEKHLRGVQKWWDGYPRFAPSDDPGRVASPPVQQPVPQAVPFVKAHPADVEHARRVAETPMRSFPVDHSKLAGAEPEGEVTLGKGALKMLTELARRHPLTLTRSQLGTLSGYAAGGGTFGNQLSILRKAGYLDESADGSVRASEAGMAFIGEKPVAPQTHEEVMAMWHRNLPAGPRKMLDVLEQEHPNPLTRIELGEKSGYEASGGTFGNNLSVLRTNGLVEELPAVKESIPQEDLENRRAALYNRVKASDTLWSVE